MEEELLVDRAFCRLVEDTEDGVSVQLGGQWERTAVRLEQRNPQWRVSSAGGKLKEFEWLSKKKLNGYVKLPEMVTSALCEGAVSQHGCGRRIN
jgi:hypothetical protein